VVARNKGMVSWNLLTRIRHKEPQTSNMKIQLQ